MSANGTASTTSTNSTTSIIELDRPRCEGHGLCEEAAPQLMHLDDDGELVLDVTEVDGTQLEAAKAAVRVCPVAALRLVSA